MTTTYSTHDIEAEISDVIEQVRQGKTVTIYQEGKVFAEIRPLDSKNGPVEEDEKQTLEERLEDFRRRGILVSSDKPRRPFKLGEPSPGALKRFLADRNE